MLFQSLNYFKTALLGAVRLLGNMQDPVIFDMTLEIDLDLAGLW
jgi:hypothetical protein